MQTKSSKGLPINHETKSEWSEVTPGERFSIRVASEETNGAYTMLEVVADYRNGTPMHVHQNEDEHFMILEGTAHLAYGALTSGWRQLRPVSGPWGNAPVAHSSRTYRSTTFESSETI